MSQEGSPTSQRRRGDALGNTARALDWSSRPSDLPLHPHSPLALADVLSRGDGCFDLIPEENAESGRQRPEPQRTYVDPQIATLLRPMASPRPRSRRTRQRMNLLTQLEAADLRQRCRDLMVENALVKKADEQRLYLAAGFIVSDGLRAPVLLYPALLLNTADKPVPEVQIRDSEPDSNTVAFASIKSRFGLTVPVRESAEPLTDYFARLAAAITPVQGLELQFDIALGNAKPAFHQEPRRQTLLPDVPECFDVSLAMTLARNVSLDELNAMLRLIPDLAGVNDSVVDHSAQTVGDVASLRELSVKLAARSLDNIAFDQLPESVVKMETWLAHIIASRRTSTVSQFFADHQFTVRQLARLGAILELVDKAPADLESSGHGNYAYASTEVLMRRARHQAQLIQEEFELLQQHFVMELIPSKHELLQLIEDLDDEITPQPSTGDGIINADYFHARRRFMEFSRENPAQLDSGHRKRLMQLAKALRFRELFVNNTEYRLALGGSYRGLRTDWAQLAKTVAYARELANVVGSEDLASIAIADFAGFRSSLINDLDLLRTGSESLRDAVTLFGREWENRSLREFCKHISETALRLHEWNDEYLPLAQYGAETPASVLSQFTGQSRRDAETERRVREARDKIAATLRSGRSDPTMVAETLDWLRDAGKHASERQLDIDAIMDHLQIA